MVNWLPAAGSTVTLLSSASGTGNRIRARVECRLIGQGIAELVECRAASGWPATLMLVSVWFTVTFTLLVADSPPGP